MTPGAAKAKRWYAIYCKHRHERAVRDRLALQGFTTYVADYQTQVRWGKRERMAVKNLLPGYVFVHTEMGTTNYLLVLRTLSVVKVVGRPWPKLSWIEDEQMGSLQLLLQSREQFREVDYWSVGDKAEVTAGPLRGLHGFYAGPANARGYVVLSIDLLKRSVAVEVETGFLRRIAPLAVAC